MPFRLSWTLPGYRRLRRSRSIVAASLLLAPMGVGLKLPNDSPDSLAVSATGDEPRATTLRFGAGMGRYGRTIHDDRFFSLGYSDCAGGTIYDGYSADFNFKDEYHDYGGQLDVQASDHVHVGLRGGWIDETASYVNASLDPAIVDTLFAGQTTDNSITQYYVSPYVSYEYPAWGLGVGFVYSDNRLWTDEVIQYGDHDDASFYPTGHARLGRLDQVYLTASMWEGVPIYSGGGAYTFGVGLRPVRPLDVWVGMAGGGPYTNRNFLVRLGADLTPHVTLGTAFRLKSDADDSFHPNFSEYGGSVTLDYRFLRE